jgi:hypothetical protein
MQIAGLHARTYAAQIAALRQEQADDDSDTSMSDEQRTAAKSQRQVKIAGLQGQADLQAMQDQWVEFSQTAVGGAITALQEFTATAMDNASQMKTFISSTLGSVNKTLLDDITGQRKRGEWTVVGRGVATDVAGSALKKGESAVLGAFGFGAQGTRSNPMWVKSADSGTSSSASALTGSGGVGGMLSTLTAFIPHFAGGGSFGGGTTALVGENGPEVVHFGSAGHVTPNGKSSGGGRTTQHFHIDATGASDPAQTAALVKRSIMEAAPHIAAMAIRGQKDMNSRLAPSARG